MTAPNIEQARLGNLSSRFKTHTQQEVLIEMAKLRKDMNLNSNSKRDQNFAYMDFNIEGDSGRLFALSGKTNTPELTRTPIDTERFFETIIVGRSREFDTEVKFFEELAKRYNPNRLATVPEISGRVRITSELKICESCVGVIDQFKTTLPNIEVAPFRTGPFANRVQQKGK